jgi:hypothetical protein
LSAADRDRLHIAQKLLPHTPPSTADRERLYAREEKSCGKTIASDHEGKKIAAGSTLANCQFNYAKPLEMTYF